ncbi:MAG TPA: GNAT family N-acetyltransferase [Candidatus Saccharimonadales bacterium]|nr:GNAT family N-acetyltransferase [Candidatus Saccharimonadales bacterium]
MGSYEGYSEPGDGSSDFNWPDIDGRDPAPYDQSGDPLCADTPGDPPDIDDALPAEPSGGGAEVARDHQVRAVTATSVAADLETGRLSLHPKFSEGLAEAIDDGDVSFFVAESPGGEPRGQVGVNWRGSQGRNKEIIRAVVGDAPNLAFMEVSSGHRGHGIGKELVQTVVTEAERLGHTGLFLTVEVDNPGARRFYEREGFEHTGVVVTDVQHNRDESGQYGEPEFRQLDLLYRRVGPAATS